MYVYQSFKPRTRTYSLRLEWFNDWGERGYDDFVSGEVTKTAPSGDRLHDPLHSRQACPEFIAFDQAGGWSNMFPVKAIFVLFPPKTGANLLHPRPPPIVERVFGRHDEIEVGFSVGNIAYVR